ncbi:UPF0538 protein C2orf76 homolog [Denticeps clupeoides]|uniref:CB076 protein n=1 Tax=Denticeps clupeoides TaxID=299321 RepID=A0AAY4C113_9TELE|nr:UPF0538 protein C2orf76 homolog [Denticeps clupeoides]
MSGGAVVTVRLVRSFEHRNFKPLVYRDVSLEQSVAEFVAHVKNDVSCRSGVPPPFRRHDYDSMKIVHQAHGAKTSELVMSLDEDEKLILRSDCSLRAAGVQNETELAFFKMTDYQRYKLNPQASW